MQFGKRLRTFTIEPLCDPVRALTSVRIEPVRRPLPARVKAPARPAEQRRP